MGIIIHKLLTKEEVRIVQPLKLKNSAENLFKKDSGDFTVANWDGDIKCSNRMNNIVVQEIQMKILMMLLQQMMIGIHKMLTKERVRMVKFWKLVSWKNN